MIDCLEVPTTRTYVKEISEKFLETKSKKKPTETEKNKYNHFKYMLSQALEWFSGLNY